MGDQSLSIADLLFDVANPRLAGVRSQRDALQKIIDDQGEKLAVLAGSVADEGLNPMDRFLVLREGGDGEPYTVLEGNRRLAALKILANSAIITDLEVKASIRRELERLAKEFDRKLVEPLACFEVKNRQEGNSWILLRHTGENGGKGVVGWSGLAASRFRGQDPALQALEFVRAFGGLSDAQKEKLEDRFPITTLDRLLSTRDVRARLGFDVKDGKLVSGLPADELLKPLRKMVMDLAEKTINVSGLKNRAQQNEYLDKWDKQTKPDLTKNGTLRSVEVIGVGDFNAKPKPRQPPRRDPDPSVRRTLVPRNHKISVKDNRIAGILHELVKVKVEDAPNGMAVLFRVFLELSVDHYMDLNSMATTETAPNGKVYDKSLRVKVEEAVDHLVSKNLGTKKDYASVMRALSDKKSPLSIDLLNEYVHNRFTTPKTHDLTAAWDDSRRFFEGLWK